MSLHTCEGDLLNDGLDPSCARCEELSNHPVELSEANRARILAGHCYTDLDLRAHENLARPSREAWRDLHRCPECARVTSSRTRIGNEHWPYCSKATIEQKSAWSRREELRSLRTIGRIGG